MIIKCNNCPKYFDDQFRSTICPHDTFLANDGQNWFTHYPQSWLADYEPRKTVPIKDIEYPNLNSVISEYDAYQKFLNKNKVKI